MSQVCQLLFFQMEPQRYKFEIFPSIFCLTFLCITRVTRSTPIFHVSFESYSIESLLYFSWNFIPDQNVLLLVHYVPLQEFYLSSSEIIIHCQITLLSLGSCPSLNKIFFIFNEFHNDE